MAPTQLQLVARTFAQATAVAETTASLFYRRLFQLDPSLRMAFSSIRSGQSRRWLQMIESAVHSASDSNVDEAGRHEASLCREHCDAVGTALILAMQQGLGPSFTMEARQAWLALFDLLGANTPASAGRSISGLQNAYSAAA